MKTSFHVVYKQVLCVSALGVLVLAGQNCAPGFMVEPAWSVADFASSADFPAAKAVLEKNCNSCHGGASPVAARFDFATEQQFISSDLVKPGKPDESKILQRLKNFAGTTTLLKNMPTSGELSDSEYNMLRSWILTAKIPSDSGAFTCNANDPLTERLAPTSVRPLSNRQLLNTIKDFYTSLVGPNTAQRFYDSAINSAVLPTESEARFPRNFADMDKVRLNSIYLIVSQLATSFAIDENLIWSVTLEIGKFGSSPTCSEVNLNTISMNNTDPNCRKQFIRNLGLKLYRRPLIESSEINEVDEYLVEFSGVDAPTAVGNLLIRFMLSQNFLIHMEDKESVVTNNDRVLKLTSYSIANRLSYTFWNSMPDQRLFDLAKEDLRDDAKFVEALEYVLSSPKADDSLREFADGWLLLKRTPKFDPNNIGVRTFNDGVVFDEAMGRAMVQEVEDLFVYTTRSGGQFSDLFNTTISFTRYAPLMRIYGVTEPAPENITPSNAVRLPAGQRSGILTRAALLADASAGPHPIKRGVFVKRDLLCMQQAPAPADTTPPVPLTEEEIRTFTTRQKTAHMTGKGSCVGCHQTINQFGWPLLKYNGLGFYKETEPAFTSTGQPTGEQLTIDSTSDLSAVLSGVTEVKTPMEYSSVIASRKETQACFTRQYANYFLNREPDNAKDGCRMNKFTSIIQRGGTLKDAIRTLATDPEFRLRKLPQ